MEYCSPLVSTKNKKICYSRKSLLTIIKSWNILNHNNKIIINKSDNSEILLKKIDDKFKEILNKKNTYWAWTDIIKFLAKNQLNYKIIEDIKKIENTELRPAQPKEWVENPVEWLSNFDIEKVLRQYEAEKTLKYKFLGVFSIDFGLKKNNVCLISNHCIINIKKIIESKKKYLGFITNLSKSHEPGTHWTSSFFILDPKIKSFGGYYYDSTTGRIPNDLIPVFLDIKKQIEEIYKKPFNIYINNKLHQRSNTECGVFSIAFQTRWILLLRKNKNTTLEDVVNHRDFSDEYMKKLRYKFFRPNVNYLKKY